MGAQSACTSPNHSRGALNGRPFPAQWQARHLTGQSARPGEAATLRGRFSEAPGKAQAEPPGQLPVRPTTLSARGPPRNGTGGSSWSWETFLARSGSRLFLLPTLSLRGPKLSRKPPQGVLSRRHSAFGVNAAGRPELSSRRAAAAVTHREDAHADWGLQQARHLEPSHPATAGAGAGAGTFDKELLGQRKAPSAESQASRREHTTL